MQKRMNPTRSFFKTDDFWMAKLLFKNVFSKKCNFKNDFLTDFDFFEVRKMINIF
jgi:hypothetical protein